MTTTTKENPLTEETRIALKNYDWLVRNRGLDNAALAWDVDTLVYGDGGVLIEELARPGFTPATDDPYGRPICEAPPW